MGCCDPSTTTAGSACCSIHGTVPTGVGVRWDSEGVSGPSVGVQVPVYIADSDSAVPIVVTSSQRLWVAWIQLVVSTAGDARVYRGVTANDYQLLGRVIVGGPFSANGGIVASLPWVRGSLGQNLWVKTTSDDPYQVVGYGLLETIL